MTFGTLAILLATLLAGAGFVTFGLVRARRQPVAEMDDTALADELALVAEAQVAPEASVEAAEELAARMEGLIAEQTRRHVDALAGLRADIQHLKSDVEWLAGERMIEQAIALAQSGLEPDDIGRELGLTRDTAETIAVFRKH